MTPNQGSPFKQIKQGPGITPATMGAAGRGGQQNPAYLQMRRPMAPTGAATTPVITSKAGIQGDTVNPPMNPAMTGGPARLPKPPQAGGQSLGNVYNFFKSDLQNQAKQAKSGAIADASARGVYYGTPLTGSEADIDTQYQRGLGQLDAGMYGNLQADQLARLGMATNLSAQSGASNPGASGPMDWSGLGALFGANNTSAPGAPGTPQRKGPIITPGVDPKFPKTLPNPYATQTK